MDTTDGDGVNQGLRSRRCSCASLVICLFFLMSEVLLGKNIQPCLEVTSSITFNYYCCKIEGDFY